MFKFKEELAKYRESLEASDLAGGVSGDEVRDVLDIAKELASARAYFEPPKAAEPQPRQEDAEVKTELSAEETAEEPAADRSEEADTAEPDQKEAAQNRPGQPNEGENA